MKKSEQKEFRTYEFHTIKNEAIQRHTFLASIFHGKKYEPKFLYLKETVSDTKINGTAYKKELLLATKSQSETFSDVSRKMYGTISSKEKRAIESKIRKFYASFVPQKEAVVTAQEAKIILEKIYKKLGLGTKVKIKKVSEMNATMSASSVSASIRKDYEKPLSEAIRQLAHEPIHTIVRIRGKTHPAKNGARKTTKSLRVEEGITMAIEEITFAKLRKGLGLPRNYKAERSIFPELRAFAVKTAEERGFYDTFMALKSLGANNDVSWSMAIRAKRGMPDVSRAGANYKDIAYIKGRRLVDKQLVDAKTNQEKIAILDTLAQGRFSLSELKRFREIGLENPKYSLVESYPKIFKVLEGFVKEKLN